MVTVKEIKRAENAKGEPFFGLIVQAGAVPVKSKQTWQGLHHSKDSFRCYQLR